jgi:hypothetical protein
MRVPERPIFLPKFKSLACKAICPHTNLNIMFVLYAHACMRDFVEVRQPRGMPLIKTEDLTPIELKEIASRTVKTYKRLSLINYIKSPKKH